MKGTAIMETKQTYQIVVTGTGYVGLSNAILLAQHNDVTAVDIIQSKVDMINAHKSPIIDKEIEEYLSEKKLNLMATTDGDAAYAAADFVVISTRPTTIRRRLLWHEFCWVGDPAGDYG